MKVVIDARKLGDGGIGSYLETLITGLLSLQERSLNLSLLVAPSYFTSQFSEQLNSDFGNESFQVLTEGSKKYSFSEYFLLPFRQRKLLADSDIFHSPHYTLPFGLSCKSIVTIHDVIHISHPENATHSFLGPKLIASAASRADGIITVSDAAKESILRHVRVNQDKLTVIYNSLRQSLPKSLSQSVHLSKESLRELSLSKSFYLFVGSDRPHKGFTELVEAWKLLKERQSGQVPEIVIVGNRFGPASRRFVEEAGLSANLKFVGSVDEQTLARLYQSSKALLLPSREEGFGLSALEAMHFGSPVICSPVPAIEEVCGAAALVARDFSSAALLEAVEAFDKDEELCSELIELGKRQSLNFEIEKMARKTLNYYQRVLTGSSFEVEDPSSTRVAKGQKNRMWSGQ